MLDTAKPFAEGAAEIEQYLRGPIGWPTYQQGMAGESFYRFDPDGYARFDPTERLDQDHWEVTCTAEPVDCKGQRGLVHLTIGKDGRLGLAVNGAGNDVRYSLDDAEAPAATTAEITRPDRIGTLFAASRLVPANGTQALPIDGLEAAAVYVRWAENGQADELAFDANPRRPFGQVPKPKPAAPAADAKAPPPAPAATASAAAKPAQAPSTASTPGTTPSAAKAAPPAAPSKPAAAAVAIPAPPAASGGPASQAQIATTAPAAASPAPAKSSKPLPPAAARVATGAASGAAPDAAPVLRTVQAALPAASADKAPTPPAAGTRAAVADGSTPPARPKAAAGRSEPLPAAGSQAACEPGRIAPAKLQKPIDSLRGLQGVHVVTDFLMEPPALKGKLRREVEAALRSRFETAGIRLLSKDEVDEVPGRPQMEFYLTPGDAAKGCVFRVWMSLRQEVVLGRDTSIHLLTGTWGDGGVARPASAGSAELETFTYYIERFVADYRVANGSTAAPPATKANVPASPPSAAEESEDTVRALQILLRDNGYDPGTIDGQMGQRTRGAIEAFERDNDLRVTGAPSSAVLERLLARRPEGPT
ncbi:MAG TPA: peptidoglycan-binding protein [Geminicoccus sp.]|uniref:peptidoglycan-binding domain-containing protein n=1 Tax=Geminicoccus sp. TaxID=2024832 RepID=UPI002E35E5AD|nr:peptidoglycan-binding protein [Geminicoccus sp.]HEX2526663.1 peptidoglycan-binding protein [Geminicoccus sp.]